MPKIRILISILLALMLLAFPASATEMSVVSKIKEPTAHCIIEISQLKQPVSIPLYLNIKNMVLDQGCSYTKVPQGYVINCQGKDQFKIEFDFESVFTKDKIYTFRQEIIIPTDLDKLYLKAILPDGAALIKEDPYLPIDGKYATDGRNIFVHWERENVKRGDLFTIQLSYEKFNVQNVPFLALAIIAGTIIVIYLLRRRGIEMYLPVLREDEKIIMQKILEHKSGVHQKLIVRESGYSKAKVSKVLKALEQRGIIKLERIGRTNKVYLNPDFKNKG